MNWRERGKEARQLESWECNKKKKKTNNKMRNLREKKVLFSLAPQGCGGERGLDVRDKRLEAL